MSIVKGYDAIVFVSFGGPDGPDDVLPFLRNVTRGRNIPEERLLEVAEHYQHFGGVSPINAQNRDLIAATQAALRAEGVDVPVYWGNRNWHPLLEDTMRRMRDEGIHRALAFVTSAFSSYSGCRQYREDILRAREAVGPQAPEVDKIRVFFNHPGFIAAMVARLFDALAQMRRHSTAPPRIVFTAHSIPRAMAENSRYVVQLREASQLVAEGAGYEDWDLVYQSRSGPPQQPWLEPDILDYLRHRAASDPTTGVVVVPIGFISDHMEVLYDLDTEAADLARELALPFVRCETVGTHPTFVQAVCDLIRERLDGRATRACVGGLGPNPDVCLVDCCLPGAPPVIRGTS